MIALCFACLIACIFASVVMFESQDAQQRRFAAGARGLLSWLVSGNWPAKVGGALLIVGIGALIRFALLHIDVSPESKLAGGLSITAVLFGAAHWVRTRFGRREIAVALAGAAFGVAYLTAYSAYALFHYLDGFAGLALLAVVAAGAGIYSIIRNAISLALLAMFGAFLAPAFALDEPSAGVVFGYYLAISQLTLAMIALRGWRALIHLSFIFSVAGGVFFAWTSSFYSSEYFTVMQPLLLALLAVHVAMPLVEQRSAQSRGTTNWMARFDLAYFVALPTIGAGLLAGIAPTVADRSTSLLLLGGIWLLAAFAARLLVLGGALRHALVGVLLLGAGTFLRTPEWPWLLIGQAISVATLIGAQKLSWPRAQQNAAIGFGLLFTTLFLAVSLGKAALGLPFANEVVIERAIAGVMLIAAWRAAHRLEHPLAPFLGWVALLAWVNTVAAELYRWDIASWPLILHIACVLAAFVVWTIAPHRATPKAWVTALAVAISVTAWWSADQDLAWVMILAAPLSLLAVGLRSNTGETDYANGNRVLALTLAPVVTWIWARPLAELLVIVHDQFALALGALCTLAVVSFARVARTRSDGWIETVHGLFAMALGAFLFFFTTLLIQRGIWPVSLEILCLAGLMQLTAVSNRNSRGTQVLYAVSAVGVVLTLQATVLRLLGDGTVMTAFDVLDLRWPAVISLFWSSLGAALTVAARRLQSRTLWSAGATILVACAVKLILLDFGSLGDLANILAVIAAGLMFLVVSWLAPLPPKRVADQAAAMPP